MAKAKEKAKASTADAGEPADEGQPANEGDPTDIAASVASIVRSYLDVVTSEARRLYDRSRERPAWRPEDVVGDYTDLMEHLTPLAERSIDLTIQALRPWAQAIQGGGGWTTTRSSE